MSARLFVLLSLLAFSSAFLIPSNVGTEHIEAETLSSNVQEYLKNQFIGVPDSENIVELEEPPVELQEAAAHLFHPTEVHGSRMKRKVIVCRYIAIRNRRTRKTVVVIRCPK